MLCRRGRTECADYSTRFDYLDDFTVLVGEEEARFVVHTKITCETSDFFRVIRDGS